MSLFREKVYPVRKFRKNYKREKGIKFSNGVYKIVKKIPQRSFLTYKEIAKLAGKPKAWRAVGNILNKNWDPKIPCHRVIKSNGKIGGYKNGIKRKISLLKKEGILIKNDKIVSITRF